MIYKILIGLVCATVLGGSVYYGNKTEYTQQAQTSTSTPVVGEEVDETYPDEVLKASEEAKKAVLRAFELEQERIDIVKEMEAKKAEYNLYVKAQEGKIDTIDKELKTY